MRGRRFAPVESSQVHVLLTWVINLLVGAAFNVVVLTFLAYILGFPWSAYPYSLLSVFAASLLLPIFFAAVLTESEPRRIIMPPSYIQALTGSWFIATVPIDGCCRLLPSMENAALLLSFALLGLAVNDFLTPKTLGYAVSPDTLPMHCFVAEGRITDVQDHIMADVHRKIIGLQKEPVPYEGGMLLRTAKSRQYQVLVMLNRRRADSETEIIITAFNKDQYQINVPDTVKQLAREKALYIVDILTKPEAPRSRIIVRKERNKSQLAKNRQQLTSFILDSEAIGMFDKITKVSANAWVRIALFGMSYVVPVYFYLTNDVPNALVSFAMITVTLAVLSGVRLFRSKTS
jgi:hypothetical protein